MSIPKTTKVERLFFKEFGINKYQAILRKIKVGGFTQEYIMVYPQINADILIQIMCILCKNANFTNVIGGKTPNEVKDNILNGCINQKEYVLGAIKDLFNTIKKEECFYSRAKVRK